MVHITSPTQTPMLARSAKKLMTKIRENSKPGNVNTRAARETKRQYWALNGIQHGLESKYLLHYYNLYTSLDMVPVHYSLPLFTKVVRENAQKELQKHQ